MTLPELLESLNALEDKIPIILGCKHQGVQMRLSPDVSGCLEAELKPSGSPPEAFRIKTEMHDSYFAYGGFDSLDELHSMLTEPECIEWSPKM